MNEIKTEELQRQLRELRPEDWDRIPDIGLYMDQVISYMKGQHIGFELENEETLTSAMINNYIKSGLLPRAKGKKYHRIHLVHLTAICLLKQVMSVKETGILLNRVVEDAGEGEENISAFYSKYIDLVGKEYLRVADTLDNISTPEDVAELAFKLAISSYAEKLVCGQLVEILAAISEVNEKNTKK